MERRGRFDRAASVSGHRWRLRNGNANEFSKNKTPEQAVDYVAAFFGLNLSQVTRDAMIDYVNVQRANEPWIGWWEPTNLFTMAMMTPEMHLA